MKLAALLMLLVAGIAAPAGALGASSERDAAGGIPQAHAVRGCAGAGPYWPTMTLALQGRNAWVACKEQSRLVRLRLPGGRKTATVNFGGPVTAVAVGYGSVWALDGSTLYRLDRGSGRITRRIQLGARAPYNIWLGAGSVWVADDQGAAVVRVSLSTNKVVARIAVGDGPADMAFRGMQGWVVTHRDNTVYSVDTATNRATRLATVGGSDAAAERIALLGDALWITGAASA